MKNFNILLFNKDITHLLTYISLCFPMIVVLCVYFTPQNKIDTPAPVFLYLALLISLLFFSNKTLDKIKKKFKTGKHQSKIEDLNTLWAAFINTEVLNASNTNAEVLVVKFQKKRYLSQSTFSHKLRNVIIYSRSSNLHIEEEDLAQKFNLSLEHRFNKFERFLFLSFFLGVIENIEFKAQTSHEILKIHKNYADLKTTDSYIFTTQYSTLPTLELV